MLLTCTLYTEPNGIGKVERKPPTKRTKEIGRENKFKTSVPWRNVGFVTTSLSLWGECELEVETVSEELPGLPASNSPCSKSLWAAY